MRAPRPFSWSILAKLALTSAIAVTANGALAQKVLVLGDTNDATQNSTVYFNGAAAMMQGVPGAVVTTKGGIDNINTPLAPEDLRQPNGDPYDIIVVTAVFGGISPDNNALLQNAIKTRQAGAFFLFPDQCTSCARNVRDVTVPFVNNATQWGISVGTTEADTRAVYLNTNSTLNSSFSALGVNANTTPPNTPQLTVNDYTTLNNVPPNNSLYLRYLSGIPPANSTTAVNDVAAIIVPRSQSYNGTGACMFVISDVNTILDGNLNPTNAGLGQALVNAISGSCSVDEGGIEITKTLTLPTGVTGPFDFKFEATCDKPAVGTPYSSPTLTYPNANQVVIPYIPAGANCSVKEILPTPPPNYQWAPVADQTVPTIAKDVNQPVTFANALQALPGSIHITKQLALPAGVSGPFALSFDASCDVNGTVTQHGPVTINYPAQTSADIANIPGNAQCRVTETLPAAPAGYSWGSVAPVDVAVPANAQQVAAPFTNTLQPVPVGTLRINHALAAPASFTGAVAIGVTATCSLPAAGTVHGPFTINAPADTFVDIAGIPQGASCTVSQQLPGAPSGYAWGSSSIAPATITVAAASGSAVTINNALTNSTSAAAPQPVPALGWLGLLGAGSALAASGAMVLRRRRV